MSTIIRMKRIILCMSLMYVRAHKCIYTLEYITTTRIYLYVFTIPSSHRKSRYEIIMQKMHREDYDLICRARKQFVSLKEGFLVNLRNYRLRSAVYVRCFIIWNKNEVTKGERETHMFSSDAKDAYISGWSNLDWRLREYESSVIKFGKSSDR